MTIYRAGDGFPALTAAEWNAKTSIPGIGEVALDLDTGRLRVADGVNLWASIAYLDTVIAASAALVAAFAPKLKTSGTATLVGGTVAVSNASVTGSAVVRYWRTTAGGTLGNLSLALSSGVGFTVNSDSATDTSVLRYEVVSY